MHRVLVTLALVASLGAACVSPGSTPGLTPTGDASGSIEVAPAAAGGKGYPGQPCQPDGTCVVGARCTGGTCQDPLVDDGVYHVGVEAAKSAIRQGVEVGCKRMFAECAYLCSTIWYVCAPTEAQCVEQETLKRVEDFDFPAAHAGLAKACAAQVASRSCEDLEPDTAECEQAVVESCKDDAGGADVAYGWVAAVEPASFPVTLDLHLCERVPKWIAVDLEDGQGLAVTLAAPLESTSPDLELQRLVEKADGTHDFDTIAYDIGSGTEYHLAPVDQAGRYYLTVDLAYPDGVTADVTITVSLE